MVLADQIYTPACLAMVLLPVRRTPHLSPRPTEPHATTSLLPSNSAAMILSWLTKNISSSRSPAGQSHLGTLTLAAVRPR